MHSIPLAILGGSDRKAAILPGNAATLHPLVAYKGAALVVHGRPLVAHLVERILAAPGLGPVTVVGPARVYGDLGLEAEVLDSDASVALNLRRAIEHCAPAEGPMAVMACDVLPTAEEFSRLRAGFEREPCRLWLPFVRKPEDPERLGAFGWKPAYPLVPPEGGAPVEILPGHLCFFEPSALRLPLLYRLMDETYRTRNRSVATKRTALLARVLLGLLAIDLGLLVRLRAPTRTLGILSSGLRLARELREGHLGVRDLERMIGRVFLSESARPKGSGGIRFPLVDMLSLAEDIDTEEEARALEAQLGSGS